MSGRLVRLWLGWALAGGGGVGAGPGVPAREDAQFFEVVVGLAGVDEEDLVGVARQGEGFVGDVEAADDGVVEPFGAPGAFDDGPLGSPCAELGGYRAELSDEFGDPRVVGVRAPHESRTEPDDHQHTETEHLP
nr:hypothetical protein [Streptomyces sparsogenes]